MTPTPRTTTANPLALAVAGLVLTMALALALGGAVPSHVLPLVVVATSLATVAAVAAARARRRPPPGLRGGGPTLLPDGEDPDERAASLSESRRELLAWISDDLRTPLARIRSTAAALEDGDLDDPTEVACAVLALDEEIDRLAELVGDMVELSGTTGAPTGASPSPAVPDHDLALVGAVVAATPAVVSPQDHRPVDTFDLAFGRCAPASAPAARRPDGPGAGAPT